MMQTASANKMKRLKSKKSTISITSSGRASKTPKHLLTTSEDEVLPKQKIKGIMTIAEQKERLRNILKTIVHEKEDTQKTNNKENVSPNPISSKSRQIPLKGTKSHSTHKGKTNDNGSASRKASSNRIKSYSSTVTSSHLEHPSTDSGLNVSIQQMDPQVSERQSIEKDVESSVGFSIHNNYEDRNNSSVEITKTTGLPTSNHTTETGRKSHSFDYGGPPSPRLDQSTSKMGLDRPPTLLLNLEKLMTDMIKQNDEIIRQNETLKEQNKQIKELITEDLFQRNVGEAKLSETLFQPLRGFPLETVEQFDELNTDRKLRKNLYNHLKVRGATKLREFIHMSLGATMTDKLVSQFKWLGDATSPKLGNTRVMNVLYVAAKDCPYFIGPGDKNTFKNEMIDVLRCTKQRYRNSQKKLSKQKNTKETKEKNDNRQQENEDVDSEIQDDVHNLSADEIAGELKLLESLGDSETEMNSDSELGDDEFGDSEFDNEGDE